VNSGYVIYLIRMEPEAFLHVKLCGSVLCLLFFHRARYVGLFHQATETSLHACMQIWGVILLLGAALLLILAI